MVVNEGGRRGWAAATRTHGSISISIILAVAVVVVLRTTGGVSGFCWYELSYRFAVVVVVVVVVAFFKSDTFIIHNK